MAEKLSAAMRSKIMSSIKGKNTVPEIALRRALFREGYRYSLRKKIGRVKPDVTLVSRKTCVFVDGCFWHMCPDCFKHPRSNTSYWGPKLKRNAERDLEQVDYLTKEGWKVIRVWEHEVKQDIDKTVRKITKNIRKIPYRK